MSKIFETSFPYYLIRKYGSFTFKRYYGEYIVIGKENIPTDYPVIFAPNHTNALMDALAVLSVLPSTLPVVFLARADMFNNKPAARWLEFCKIMPAFRMRDGVENLGKNSEIFDTCVDVLHQNKALAIMPEGNQETERRLRPLLKGIFRIAFAAQQKYGDKPGVKIVPVGLDFGDSIKSHKHIIITFGKPIEVSDYMNQYTENSVAATNQIKERLKNDLIHISLHLDSDNYYDCFETATEICNTQYVTKLGLPNKTEYRFVARQRIASRLIEIEENEPEKIKLLDKLCSNYNEALTELKLKNWVFEQVPHDKFQMVSDFLLLFSTSTFYVLGLLLNFLPFFIPVYLRKKVFKTEFTGFFSSLQFALGMLTFPVFYSLQTILFYCLTPFPWWASVAFLLLQYPLGKWALRWNSIAKKLGAKLRFNRLCKIMPDKIAQIQELNDQIIQLVLQQ